MNDSDDIGVAFDSPEAIEEMRKRHLRAALDMQQLGAQGLAELREHGKLTVEECKRLLADGLELEKRSN